MRSPTITIATISIIHTYRRGSVSVPGWLEMRVARTVDGGCGFRVVYNRDCGLCDVLLGVTTISSVWSSHSRTGHASLV